MNGDGGSIHNDEGLVNTALKYLGLGWSVLPIKKNTKIPHVKWKKFQSQLPTEREIRQWFKKWPSAQIGIVTGRISGVFVIDFDSPAGLDAFENTVCKLPQTIHQHTGRKGGMQFLFKHPGGEDIKSVAGILEDVDVRADKALVVLPPSVHPSGNQYRWGSIDPTIHGLTDLLTPPAEILEFIQNGHRPNQQTQGPQGRAEDWVQEILTGVKRGQRNTVATRYIGWLLSKLDGDETAAWDAAKTWNDRNAPPLDPQELQRTFKSIAAKEAEKKSIAAKDRKQQFNRTDLGNAERFKRDHEGAVIHCARVGGWHFFDGKRWVRDETEEVKLKAKETVRGILREASQISNDKSRGKMRDWSKSSESDARIRAMLNLAKAELPIRASDLDKNPDLLNCQNGTLDTKTFELQPHDPLDLITNILPVEYNPDAKCPLWMRFLREIMAGNQEVIDFLKRAVGYSLTGSTEEQCFFYLYGTGANGKSTFLEVLRTLLAAYARQANFSTLVAVKNDTRVRNDIARLKGARFVTAVEAESEAQMAESTIKAMTGGDTITARFLYREEFEYVPEFKIWLAANHKLGIKGTDDAIWRRPKLIPFKVTIPPEEMDTELPKKLKTELPGILTWAVEGCQEWRKIGLRIPTDIKQATAGYRAEQDSVGNYIAECLVQHPNAEISVSRNYEVYENYCTEEGCKPVSKKKLSSEMFDRGFDSKRLNRNGRIQRMWLGVGLKSDHENFETMNR